MVQNNDQLTRRQQTSFKNPASLSSESVPTSVLAALYMCSAGDPDDHCRAGTTSRIRRTRSHGRASDAMNHHATVPQ